MHDALRDRLMRRIESLPDEQVYQVLDFIEFLEVKYADTPAVEASGFQRFAESLEDKLRRKAVSPNTIREAFQLISAADRVLGGVSSAGKQIMADLNRVLDLPEDADAPRREDGMQDGSLQRAPDSLGKAGEEEADSSWNEGRKRPVDGPDEPSTGPGNEKRGPRPTEE